MIEKTENETLATSLGKTLEKSKGLVFAVFATIVVAIIAVAVVATLKSKSVQNGISQIDTISYNLTNESSELSDADISTRQNKAIEELLPLSSKGGIVGLRANMLLADIKFAQKNYSEARDAWLKAADLNKNAYTAALCYFNAGVCSENLGDNENAVSYYKNASEDEDFLLIDHALFSLGRVNEELKNFDSAKEAYEKLSSDHATSNWGQIAKSRLIALKVNGSIQ